MTDPIELGKRIETARDWANLSLSDVAADVGVAISTIQRYEKGKIQRIKLPVVESIASTLNVTPDWLLQKTDDPYDYDTDPNGVLDSIPSNICRELTKMYPDDLSAVYHAWQAIENDCDAVTDIKPDTDLPTYDVTPPEYEMVCAYRVADDDTKSIVDTALKRYKNAPASEDAGDDASTYQAAARSGERVRAKKVSLEDELAALPPKRKRDI